MDLTGSPLHGWHAPRPPPRNSRPPGKAPRRRATLAPIAAAAVAAKIGKTPYDVHVAPMMQVTHRHMRFLCRLLSKRLVLWTEMIKDSSITYNRNNPEYLRKLLDMSSSKEHPVVLQLGGSDPDTLAEAVRIAKPWGYDEINLNCGCPSEAAVKVRQGHGFGAQLMTTPELVRQCTEAMAEEAEVDISVKCRIGTHQTLADLERNGDHYDTLLSFVDAVAAGKVKRFAVHARSGILAGLKASENRKTPPLHHDFVYRLQAERPELEVILNGGVCSQQDLDRARQRGLEVMIGRWAVQHPWALADEHTLASGRGAVFQEYLDYARKELRDGREDHLLMLSDPLRNLFAGIEKCKEYRRVISTLGTSPREARNEESESAFAFIKKLTWKSFISYPSSLTRLSWDMFGGVLIMYDLFAVPLQAFNPPQSTGLLIMDWLTLIFWTLNVGMSLTTGYVQEGITIMEPKKIVYRYLRTWCIVDLVVLVPDWVFTIIASDSSSTAVADFSKMPRVVRLARVVRLLRLVRLKRLFEQIEDALDSEYYSVLFNIFKMMLLLFTVNHVIACGWYALADANRSDAGINTWTKEWQMQDFPWEHLYLVSLHWSLTQFTPAGMDVTPTNEVERGFTIGVVVFALVGFAYVVGSITASLAQLRTMSEEASKDFWQMRRFLNQNSVAARIQRFVEYTYSRQQKTMSINQVKVLSLLSKQLMEELQCAINLPHMKVHPLFMFLNEFSFITMNRCAKESISHMETAQGDTLFLPEQHANCMYFVSFGRLEYIRMIDNHGTEVKEFVDKAEDWLAEPALWTEAWYHVGEAKAYTDCEVLMVDPKAFEEILNVVRPVASIVANYCRSFMAWLQNLESEEGMLTDVIQGDQVSDTIQSFLPMWMVEKPDETPGKMESAGDLLRGSRWSFGAFRRTVRKSLRY